MPDFTVAPGETITINVTGVAAAGAAANNNANFPNAAGTPGNLPGVPNGANFGGGYRRNRKNKTNRRNRKNKTNRRNRIY